MGQKFGKIEVAICAFLPFFLNLLWLKKSMFLALFPYITLPLAIEVVYGIWQKEPGKIYNYFLEHTAFLHLSFGMTLSLGFWLL